ncbi:MAG: prolipoprotein diacylglyceryl transferase [Armatimonadetes bacterium]|nr:prolipoprotein diacylglyceryl transferase [Armatimonadota bacterium]
MMPEIFSVGPFVVRGYGLMWVVGIIVAVLIAARRAPRFGMKPENAIDSALAGVFGGVVGARIVYVAMNWREFRDNWLEVFAIWQGGLGFFGGLVGGSLGVYLCMRAKKMSFWPAADCFAPSLALAYAIARLGCLLAGCCYGCPTGVPWGLTFPMEDRPGVMTEPSHPTQIYSFLFGLGIFAALLLLEKRKRFTGQTFCQFLMLYGAYRFVNEFFRAGATSKYWVEPFTFGHLAAIGALAFGLALYLWRSSLNKSAVEPSKQS